jgi:hypothetical protein
MDMIDFESSFEDFRKSGIALNSPGIGHEAFVVEDASAGIVLNQTFEYEPYSDYKKN